MLLEGWPWSHSSAVEMVISHGDGPSEALYPLIAVGLPNPVLLFSGFLTVEGSSGPRWLQVKGIVFRKDIIVMVCESGPRFDDISIGGR